MERFNNLVLLVLILVLSACGGGGATVPTAQQNQPVAELIDTPTSTATSTPTPTEPTTPTATPTAIPPSTAFSADPVNLVVERVPHQTGETSEKQIITWPEGNIVIRAENAWTVEREDGCSVQVRAVSVLVKAEQYIRTEVGQITPTLRTDYYDLGPDIKAWRLPTENEAILFGKSLRNEAEGPNTVVHGRWPSQLLSATGYYENEPLPECQPDGYLDLGKVTSGVSVFVVQGPLRVRRDPDSSFDIIGVLEKGAEVELISDSNPDWFFVRLPDGTEGWISRAFARKQ